MDELISTTPHYVRIAPGEAIPDVRSFAPFKAVVVIEAPYSSDWQNEVSAWLVASGCRYMMAWGPECSSWDDSVDLADIDAGGLEDNSKFVLTTWHEDETLEDVFWYSQFCAIFSYDEQELRDAVILHISESDREAEYLRLFKQSETLAERQPD